MNPVRLASGPAAFVVDRNHRHSPLSHRALATRSLIAAERLRDSGDRAGYQTAIEAHRRTFGLVAACRLR